jgi:hypothetical protein
MQITFAALLRSCFSQYIACMLWRVRNSRDRPMNAPAAIIFPARLVSRIAADPEIANPGTPRSVHCGLPI